MGWVPPKAADPPEVLPILKDFARKAGYSDEVRSVYLTSPEPRALRARLSARGDDNETIERRLEDCEAWDATARSSHLYDLFVPGEGDVVRNARGLIDSLGILKSNQSGAA